MTEWNDESHDLLDDLVRRLEEAWRSGGEVDLSQFVPTADHPLRQSALLALIPADQELRLRHGKYKAVEDYLAEWPELQSQSDVVAELQTAEDKLQAEITSFRSIRPHDSDVLPPVLGSADKTAAFVPREQPGTVIAGRYKLLDEIPGGGMGTVWVAEQTQPVRRKVALKLIKLGMDSKSVLARFEAERQALAMMDHPNIAKVLDGGLTETGRPYFVMDYIKGMPITEYCERARLSISERLQLFVQVCQAVQHAHQKGVIHRDLKPSNILVAPYDDRPVPKVIDFGLAKAIHQPLTERTLYTAHEMVLGTVLYMSPEQAQLNNLDIDTRSDLYSLGVVLYELLTGTTPLEKQRYQEAAWDEARRIIREEDPPPPSMRLSSSQALPSLAVGRQLEPAQLTKLVRGDLDWIAMKALEKDRTRRYETANSLALDVQRYLAGEPVLAAPPSAGYRLRKFARKHRAALTTAALISLLLLAGTAFSTWQAVRATRAEAATSRALKVAEDTQAAMVLAQVGALRNAEISHVPNLVDGLKPLRNEIVPLLRQLLQQQNLPDKERLRLSLAIVSDDEGQAAYLSKRLLTADPAELEVICMQLQKYCDKLAPGMWRIVEDSALANGRRFHAAYEGAAENPPGEPGPAPVNDRWFHAACALAAFDPGSPRWESTAGRVTEMLVEKELTTAIAWKKALRPIRKSLMLPLQAVFRDPTRADSQRTIAANFLGDYAADRPVVLADLVADSDKAWCFTPSLTLLWNYDKSGAVGRLTDCLAKMAPGDKPDNQERFASRQANLAIALLLSRDPDKVWEFLRYRPDPTARSWIIHRLAPFGADPRDISGRLIVEKDASVRRALILCLGEFSPDQIPAADRDAIGLVKIYSDDPDPGIHAAAEWLLRRWRLDVPSLAVAMPADINPREHRWYISSEGQTMVILPAESTKNDPQSERKVSVFGPSYKCYRPVAEEDMQSNGTSQRKPVDHSFAIASKGVTKAQFNQFILSKGYAVDFPRGEERDWPQLAVTWYQAAAYCNWLSDKQGIEKSQWCYEPNKDSGKYEQGMKLVADWSDRTGYRLPSDAEWAYACCAGATTCQFYGKTDKLLDKYAWYSDSKKDKRTIPVASMKPNDFGLFDMLGNNFDWCQDRVGNSGNTVSSGKDEVVMDLVGRVLRGGADGQRYIVPMPPVNYVPVSGVSMSIAPSPPASFAQASSNVAWRAKTATAKIIEVAYVVRRPPSGTNGSEAANTAANAAERPALPSTVTESRSMISEDTWGLRVARTYVPFKLEIRVAAPPSGAVPPAKSNPSSPPR